MGPEMGPKSERNYKPRRSDLERKWVQKGTPNRAKRGPKSVPKMIEKRGPKKGGTGSECSRAVGPGGELRVFFVLSLKNINIKRDSGTLTSPKGGSADF